MNAHDYVAKAIADKKYMEEVVAHMPDAMVSKINQDESDPSLGSPTKILSLVLGSAAPSMGVEGDTAEVEAECESQCPKSKFAAVKLLVRIGRMIVKEARKRKL